MFVFFWLFSTITNDIILIGDFMKKNFVIPVIISIILGFISAQIIYSTYRKNLEETDYNVYLIQAGS